MLVKESLERYLKYEPLTGKLVWIVSGSGRKAGDIAGRSSASGHRKVRFNYEEHFAHDLIFTLMGVEVPPFVKYKDQDGENLTWENLEPSQVKTPINKPVEVKKVLDHGWLLENIRYDPETGEFHWLKPGPRRTLGKPLGGLHSKGYWHIELGNVVYKGHRLAWFYMNETWPIEVDHENRVKHDNRWSNLREANRTQNNQNGLRRLGELLPGVRLQGNKYVAQIQVNKVKMHIGTFFTEQEAHQAYREASLKHFGEFSPFFERKDA